MPRLAALKTQYSSLPEEVQNHFYKLEELLQNNHLEIALAYVFMLLEQGRYRTIKCILVRRLRCPSQLVDDMYRAHEFQRRTFAKTVNDTIGVDLKSAPFNILEAAESVRDDIFHGRRPSDEKLREAISNSLSFVEKFGESVKAATGKNPFGDLRGLSSRISMISKDQAKWIIKGIQISSEQK